MAYLFVVKVHNPLVPLMSSYCFLSAPVAFSLPSSSRFYFGIFVSGLVWFSCCLFRYSIAAAATTTTTTTTTVARRRHRCRRRLITPHLACRLGTGKVRSAQQLCEVHSVRSFSHVFFSSKLTKYLNICMYIFFFC